MSTRWEETISKLNGRNLDTIFQRVANIVRLKERDPAGDTEKAGIGDNLKLVKSLSSSTKVALISDDEKLRLYGLYKIVYTGRYSDSNDEEEDDDDKAPQQQSPSIFNVVGRAKFNSWKKLSSKYKTKHDAMKEYIRIASSWDNPLGNACREQIICIVPENGVTNIEQKQKQKYQKQKKCNNDIEASASLRSTIESVHSSTDDDIRNKRLIGVNENDEIEHDQGSFDSVVAAQSMFDNLVQIFGIRPLIPRGRIDITYYDLAFALYQCATTSSTVRALLGLFGCRRQSSKQYDERLKDQIKNLWVDSLLDDDQEQLKGKVVVGLSVRSLFDLYLTTKAYPDDSEIIVVPPINVPGMMWVAKYHNLRIVPVDIVMSVGLTATATATSTTTIAASATNIDSDDDDNDNDDVKKKTKKHHEWIDINELKTKITSKTVAIMVVHPFGIVTVGYDTMKELRDIADNFRIELWEDCAECFVGLDGVDTASTRLSESSSSYCYLGNAEYSDVRFFSFGTIKTATALGGGVALVRNLDSAKHMERLQQSLYTKQQTCCEYLNKVLVAFGINFISDSPYRVGLLYRIMQVSGLNFDSIITYSIRGFNTPYTNGSKTLINNGSKNYNIDGERWAQRNFIRQIRKKPSSALLAVLCRRIRQSKYMTQSSSARIRRCKRIRAILQAELPEVLLPGIDGGIMNTFWAFPIRCSTSRNAISKKLKDLGFDVPTGASQLCSLSGFTESDCDYECPLADSIMDSILYLPVCSQEISETTAKKLVQSLKCILNKPPTLCNRNQSKNVMRINKDQILIVLPIVLAVLYLWLTPRNIFVIRITLNAFAVIFAIWVVAEILLRWTTAEVYTNESSAFAENCDMIDAWHDGNEITGMNGANASNNYARQCELNSIEALKFRLQSNTMDAIATRKIIITGATGFIGSALLRDILIHRKSLFLKSVIIVCRQKNGVSAKKRIQNLLDTSIFSFMPNAEKQASINVMEGSTLR